MAKRTNRVREDKQVVEERDIPAQTDSKPGTGERLFVDVDTPFTEVVSADRQGREIVFDMNLFPTYTREQVEVLSEVTRRVYEGLQRSVEERANRELTEEEVLQRISAEATQDYATARFRIDGKDPAYDYIWPYPTDVERLRESGSWEVVSGSGERTQANPDGKGLHMIGKQGAREHVLMRRPKRISEIYKKKRVERFERAAGLIKDEFREEGERSGVPVFTSEDEIAQRNRFTDTAGARVREG